MLLKPIPKKIYVFLAREGKDGIYEIATGYSRIEYRFGDDLEEAIRHAFKERREISKDLPDDFITQWGPYSIFPLDSPQCPNPSNYPGGNYADYYDLLLRIVKKE